MSSHIISMHINLVSKLYASNLYAYWAFQQAQSAHQPQAGHQLSSHEKLQAEQLTHPPGLNEDENKAAKKAKTAMVGVEKIVEEKFQTAMECMTGEMLKQKGEMLKLLTQQESNPKSDLPVPAHVGILQEYKSLGGAYAASSTSTDSSSRDSSRDEGLGRKNFGSSRDEGIQQFMDRAKKIVQGAQHALPKPPRAIPKPDYRTREERREDELYARQRAARGRDGSSGSSDMKEDAWPPSPSPPPSPPPPSNGCAAEKVAKKKKKHKEKQGRDAHNPHSKPPDITITANGKHVHNGGTSSRPAPTEGDQETPKDQRPRHQRRHRHSKVKLDEPA